MWGLSTTTESRSSSAATSLIRAMVWALVSGPSPEANTVSLTGPASRSNSFFTVCSSRGERKPMGGVYVAGSLRDRQIGEGPIGRPSLSACAPRWCGRTADDLEHPPVARRVDPRVDQGGPGDTEGRDERALQTGLVGGCE